jgi:CheY-like chemotaxis protein
VHRSFAAGAPRIYRILVVEDNLDGVHSLCMLLREMGHTVEYAINGYVALDTAKRFRPDYVLLDLGLPGMTGFEVCQQIKRDPELSKVKVFAVTGYAQTSYQERAAQVGFDGYFVKPIDPKRLDEIFGETAGAGSSKG